MDLIKKLFPLSFVAVGLFVLAHLFIKHTDVPFSEGWLAQIVFGLLFIIVGGFAFYSTNKMLRTAEKSKAALKTHPQQPWLARDDWRQGYAESETAMLSYMYLMMGLAFSLIMLPFSGKLITALQQGHWHVSFILMFPLAGIGFLIAFVVSMIRYRRYGQSRFEFSPPI
jgi:MFS family permease